MKMTSIGRIAGVLTLTAGLAGCMDITMEVEVLSETTGRATTTSVMGADFYAMAKAGMASSEGAAADSFCQDEGATLTENPDGSATCVLVVEGAFADLNLDEGEDGASFTVVRPGVVRVALQTEDMKSEMGAAGEDEESLQMMQAFFEGNAVTVRITGKTIIDTNMTLSADGKSAETVIPFLELIDGSLDLPDELYATVDTN